MVFSVARISQKFRLAFAQPGGLQRLLLAVMGGLLAGLLAFLLTTPAGLTRVGLELYAEDVWSPQIFGATWVNDGLWQVPSNLPADESVPASLEIMSVGNQGQAMVSTGGRAVLPASAKVWLVKAFWPDGSEIPLNEFKVESGWQQQQLDWGAYQNQSVWVAQTDKPGTLRWQGRASGPLTLLFASNPQSGWVTVRWQGREQNLDLLASAVGFKAVTLAAQKPAVWRTELPLSALRAREINLTMQPDPSGNYPAVFQKLRVTGLPGPALEFDQTDLPDVLQIKNGHTEETSGGMRMVAQDPRDPLEIFIATPGLTNIGPTWLDWVGLVPPLGNIFLVLGMALIGFVFLGGLALRLPANFLTNLNLLLISILVPVLLGEAGLRFYLPPAGKYYVWPPNLHQVFRPDPTIMPGMQGESHFIVNSQGIRGDEFSPDDDYRILAIGGSTTECLYLDQTEAWPYLIQNNLNKQVAGQKIWVGNTGKSARTSREHLLHVQYLIPQYPKIDTIIILVGFNDLNSGFRWGEENPFTAAAVGANEAVLKRAFDVVVKQDPFAPYYQMTALWRIVERIQRSQSQQAVVADVDVEDETGQNYVQRRKKRQLAPKIDQMPDLSAPLAEYTANLNRIVDLAEAYRVRLIFLTQPTMYRPNLIEAEEKLFWLGAGPGREYFYSSKAMGAGIAQYNQRLLEVCQQRQIECVDLDAILPKDTTVFYDETHFNRNGSRLVAGVVSDYLLNHLPFSQNQP